MMDNQHEPIITHEYDLDAIATYYRLCEIEFSEENVKSKELYLERVKQDGETYCTNNDLNFSFYFDNKIPLVIPSTTQNFELYAGLHLISYDIPKIGAFLSYQKSIYKGEYDFVNLVEFLIYRIVKNNSPLDNTVRLEKIMQWVSQQRSLLKEDGLESSQLHSDNTHEAQKEKPNKYNTLQYALFHYYKQYANYVPLFESTLKQTRKGVIREQGKEYGVSGNNFVNQYYVIYKKSNRVARKNINHLEIVAQMLSDYPAAKELAEGELKEAKSLR